MRFCRALGEPRVASIHDVRFILYRECGVRVPVWKRRDDGQELQLTINVQYIGEACMSIHMGPKGPQCPDCHDWGIL